MPTWYLVAAQVAVLAYALIGGVFLAFSDFIMRSLAKAGAPAGIEVMQAINREVFRWVFMALFLGMAPLSLVLAGYGLIGLDGAAARLVAASGVVYLAGVFGVTAARNVPLNQTLAPLDPATDEARHMWEGRYLPDWTFWNTVRTVASVAAAGLALTGLTWNAWG